jgi:hypothetical protein
MTVLEAIGTTGAKGGAGLEFVYCFARGGLR